MKLQDELTEKETVEQAAEALAFVDKEANKNEQEVPTEITDELIAAWKSEHGRIYKTIVDDETYIWRTLRRAEYVEAMSFKSEENPDGNVYYRQNIITKNVVLFPVDIDRRIEEYAGLAGEISDRAILKSGFEASETEEL